MDHLGRFDPRVGRQRNQRELKGLAVLLEQILAIGRPTSVGKQSLGCGRVVAGGVVRNDEIRALLAVFARPDGLRLRALSDRVAGADEIR